jgi:hypothetical protein
MGAILRLLAVAASVVIALSFLMFATDEMDRGSKTQQQAVAQGTGVPEPELAQVAPAPEEASVREQQHSSIREAIDDANDVLLQPFSTVADGSNSNWVTRGVPTLLGLLLYGIGLGLVANFLPSRQSHAGDWRAA